MWFKSSYSSGSNTCVEVNLGVSGVVLVRDSKAGEGEALRFSFDDWRDFVENVSA